jgi:hypothetical protein
MHALIEKLFLHLFIVFFRYFAIHEIEIPYYYLFFCKNVGVRRNLPSIYLFPITEYLFQRWPVQEPKKELQKKIIKLMLTS